MVNGGKPGSLWIRQAGTRLLSESTEIRALSDPDLSNRFQDSANDQAPSKAVLEGGKCFTSRACSGTRVDAAIHRIALGKMERPKGAKDWPATVTMARESHVASGMLRLSCERKLR